MANTLKRVLLGSPLRTEHAIHQRLSNPIALAVFSSDALSSVAYATEEILLFLVLAGAAAIRLAMPIALAIGLLLVIVVASYRQTIRAYPGGGGAYIVSKENLGVNFGLVAGAALLIDYILTVAVSISAGTAAITSAFPVLLPYTVPIVVVLTLLLAIANLRGVRESGAIFAGPTYLFVAVLALLIVVGLVRFAIGVPPVVPKQAAEATSALTLFLVLKAFASGCTAMTGVEAIANGAQAFRPPESEHASTTLTWMASILLFLFLGTTLLAQLTGAQPGEQTVLSQLGRATFGSNFLYYILQAATAAILVLAANTSYADFPRLSSFMATDGFLPKQLKDRGSRLVHSNGILLLTGMALLLLVVFRGDTHRLIPLYALGVFASFTLSQTGMVLHWVRERGGRWRFSAVVNAIGALTTGVVFMVIAEAKFAQGAWIVMVLAPILVSYFKWVKRHYDNTERRLRILPSEETRLSWQSYTRLHNHVLLLVSAIDRKLVRALEYTKTIRADSVEALFVDVGGDVGPRMKREWDEHAFGVKLTVVESPYREVIAPILQYVRSLVRPEKNHVVTVVLPEFVPESTADNMLHDQTSFWLKRVLFFEPGVILVDVPYHLAHQNILDPNAPPEPPPHANPSAGTPLDLSQPSAGGELPSGPSDDGRSQ